MVLILLAACGKQPENVVVVFATSEPEPTKRPSPIPTKRLLTFSTSEPLRTWDEILEGKTQMCEVDWNWGGATLQIYGAGGQKICDDFIANGQASFGLEFLLTGDGSWDDEGVLCWLEGKDLIYLVWDEPSWQAGGEFCDFLAGFDELP